MRRGGTEISFASWYCVIPLGFRNSSSSISPGVMFESSLLFILLVIVHNFDLMGICARPAKYDSPLLIDPDAVSSFELTLQGFQPIAGRYRHLPDFRRGVQR